MNINEIGQIAHEINKANGWDVFASRSFPRSPDEVKEDKRTECEADIPMLDDADTQRVRFLCTHMALVHSEVAEATEAIRNRDLPNFREELADIIIRVTSIAHGMGIDLNTEVAAKLHKNTTRGFRHGGKAV